MNELAGQSPVPSPTCFGLGRPSGSYVLPWAIQTWIPGRVATPSGLAGSTRFADDLIRLIQALRKTDTHGRTFSGGGCGGDLPDHDEWMEHCFKQSEALLDVARLRSMWAFFRDLPTGSADVISHGDLIPANLLVDGERLVGVLGTAEASRPLIRHWTSSLLGTCWASRRGLSSGQAWEAATSNGTAGQPGRFSRPWVWSGITGAPTRRWPRWGAIR